MKKTEKYIYLVLGIILIVVIACGITYMIATNNNKTEPKEELNNNSNNEQDVEEPVLKDSVTLKNTYQEDNTIIQEYEIVLNNKVNDINIKYNYQSDEAYNNDIHEIIGNLNDNKLVVMGYNNNLGEEKYTKESIFNEKNIENIFNEENFSIIKGRDNKSYLLVQTIDIDALDGYSRSNLYLYNDNLELISKNIISQKESPDYTSYDGFIINNFIGNIPCEYKDHSPLYERTFKKVSTIDGNEQYTKVENNQIYFLFPKINTNGSGGTLEERVYTINNNKLEYKVINTYKFNSVCQQI